MMETRLLPVGTAYMSGSPPHTVELVAELVTRIRRTVPAEAQPRGGGLLSREQALYRCEGDYPFVVHTLEEFGDDPARVVGRLERFASWVEVMEEHPELAMHVAEDQRYGHVHHRPHSPAPAPVAP